MLVLLVAALWPAPPAGAAGSVSVFSGSLEARASGAWLRADGTVWTWGINDSGQLGTGASGPAAKSIAPVQMLVAAGTPMTGVVQVEVGDDTIVARKSDGTVWASGYGGCGELMRGSWTNSPFAVQMHQAAGVPITTAVDIASADRPYVVLADGRILSNQPMSGGCNQYPVPLTYDGAALVSTATDVGAYGSTVIFRRSDGTVWSAGNNGSGKLGRGLDPSLIGQGSSDSFGQMLTGPATPLTSVSKVEVGGFQTVALRTDGTVWGAGYDGYGELSNTAVGGNVLYMTRMETSAGVPLTGVDHISASAQQGIHVHRTDNSFWGAGQYEWGQQGETSCCSDPVRQRLTGYLTHSSGGMGTTLLVRSDDQAMGTGVNTRGEAGVCHTRTLMAPAVINIGCAAPYSPWRPFAMRATDADGQAMRCNSASCWTRSGVADSVVFTFEVADQDTTDSLTPRWQFGTTATAFTPTDACTAAGTALAPQSTTSTNQHVPITQTQTGLVHGTAYHARACVVDSGGRTSGWSYGDLWQTAWWSAPTRTDFTVDTVLPTAPTSVLDGNPGDDQWTNSATTLRATWSGATDADSGIWGAHYCVTTVAGGSDCATTALRTWTSTAVIPPTMTWTMSSLSLVHGTTYYICARAEDYAKNVSLASTCSNGIRIDTVAPVNSVPSDGTGADVDVLTSASALDSNWPTGTDALSGVASYDWCFTTVASGSNCASTATRTWTNTTGLTASATGLALVHGTTYYSCIRTRDQAGNVASATCSDGAVLDANAPGAVLVTPLSAATSQALSATLVATYSDADGDTGTVEFQVCTDTACASVFRSGTSAAVASGANASWATSPALNPNTTYWWRARSTDLFGRAGVWTGTRSFTTVNAPSVIDNQAGDATWRNANVATYDVDFSDGAGLANFETNVWSAAAQSGTQRQAWTQVTTLSGLNYTTNWSLLASTWTALAEGVNYVSVRVTSTSAMTTTNVDTFEVRKDTVAPPAVTTLAAPSPTLSVPSLTWTTVLDATSGVAYYRVYRGASSTGPWTQVSVDGSPVAGAFTHAAAAVGATHWYRVQAVDQAGNEAATSNVVSVLYHRAPTVTQVAPASGSSLQPVSPTLSATHADADGNTGTVQFEVCTDAACTNVIRTGSSGSVASGSNGTWAVSPALPVSTQFWWRARAVDSNGATSVWSGTWSFTTMDGPMVPDGRGWGFTSHAWWRVDKTGGATCPGGATTFEDEHLAIDEDIDAPVSTGCVGGAGQPESDYIETAGNPAAATDRYELSDAPGALRSVSAVDLRVRAWKTGGKATTVTVNLYGYDGALLGSSGPHALTTTHTNFQTIITGLTMYQTDVDGAWVEVVGDASGGGSTANAFVTAVNVDLATVTSTLGSKPTAPTLVAPASAGLTNQTPSLQATFNDPDAGNSGTIRYEICADAQCAGPRPDIAGSSASGIAIGANGSFTTPALSIGTTYWWRARGRDNSGNEGPWSGWRSFTVDGPPPAPATTNDGSGADITWTNSAVQLAANWSAVVVGDLNRYEYCFSTAVTCAGTVVATWTGNGASTTVTRASLTLVHGTTYFACVRAVDNQSNVSLTSTCSNGQTVDTVAPGAPASVADGTGADITWSTSSTQLSANWPSGTDGTSGVANHDYCITTSTTGADCATTAVVADTSTAALAVTRTGLSLTNGATYYVCVRTRDAAGNVSGRTCSNGQTVDTTAPTPPTVRNDGTGADVDLGSSSTQLSGNWSGATAGTSGIAGYDYCFSTTTTGTDCATTATAPWTTQGGVTVMRTGLALTSGTTYYLCVRTRDNAGRVSAGACSDGLLVDSAAPPAVTTLAATSPTLVAPSLTWTTVTDPASGVAYYRVYRGASSTGPWTQASTNGSPTTGAYTDSAAVIGQTHWYRVQAVDVAGNEASTSNVVSVLYHRVPDAPVLVSPASAATGLPLGPVLMATYSDPDAHSGVLNLQVCSDSTCTTVVRSGASGAVASGANGSWTVSPVLTSNTTYWWRASGTDVHGATGTWSTTRAFTTANLPNIIDNQVGDITWRNTNSGIYDVDFGDAVGLANFETNVWSGVGQTGTERQAWTQVSTLAGTSYVTNWSLLASTWTSLAEGTSHVSVRVTNTNALSSTAVDAFFVRKDTVAPGNVTAASTSPTLVAPVVTWGAAVDATSGVAYYRVYRGATSTGPWTQVNVDGATTGTTFTDAAAAFGTHYYLVRAVDLAGNVAAGGVASAATTYHRLPAAPTLVSPANAATGQALAPTLTATHTDPDGNPGTINVQVCSDAACTTVVRSGASGSGASGANGSWSTTPALASNATYWWRASSTDVHGATGPWTATWSFTTASVPSVIDNQAGDTTWRNANVATYDVDFSDGVGLASFETNVWSGAGQTGTQRQAWTQVSTTSGTSYVANWGLLASTWTAMAEGTNHVSVRVTNTNALTTTNVDTFFVRKDTVAPAAVSTLAASSPTIVAPALAWTTVADATSGVAYYRVYRGPSGTGPWTLVSTDGSVTSGSFSDTGATVNATHHYRVQAVDLAGNEATTSNVVSAYYHRAPSPPALVTPADAATNVPILPTLTATHTDADAHTGTLTFQVCSDAACTSVVRTGTSAAGIASGSNGSWSVGSALAQGTQYWWRASSADQHGAVGAWSVVRSFTTSTGPTIADNQPGDATWRSSNVASYDVDFSDASGIDRFEVRVWSGAGQTGTMRQDWTQVVGALAGTTYTTNWALPASTWTALGEGVNFVSVRAWNDLAGSSTLTDAFEVRKDTTAAAPGLVDDGPALDVDWWPSTSSFDGNWSASAGEAGMSGVLRYEYCISTGVGCTGTVARTWTSGTTATSITAIGLALVNGTQYVLAVRMVDVAGNTSASTSSDGFRVDSSAPTAPMLVTPAAAATIITLPTFTATYNDPAPSSPGQLEFQACSNATCSAVASSGTSAAGLAAGANGSWTPATLAGGSWWWRARGTDSAGTTGPWSTIRAFTLSYPPTAPTLVSPANTVWVNIATPTLTATFNDPDAGATGQLAFESCMTNAADPWSANCASGYQSTTSASGIAAGANGAATLAAIPNGATRHWRVRGNDGTSNGPWSAVRSVRIDISPPPAITTLATTTPTTSAPALTWTVVTDAESGTAFYRIYRSTSAGTLGSQVNVDGATTAGAWTDATGVGSGTWHYTVRAVDVVGNEQAVGNDQRSVSFVAPIYFRATASLATSAPASWLLSRTPGTVANVATSPRIGRSQGCSIQFVAGTSNNTPCPAAPPADPSGGGWLMDAAPGESFASGTWRMYLTVTAQRTHTGQLQVNAWKVTLDGAGAIQPGAQQITSGGWIQGLTNVGATTTSTSHFVDVPMNQVTFAAGEYLYVEAWERITAESGNNSTNVTLQVDTTDERIEPTGPIPPLSVTSTTPATLAQGRKSTVVRINGSGFQSGATASFSGGGVAVTGTTWVSASAIDVTVDVAGTAAIGPRDVTVVNPDTSSATGTAVFGVTAPSITIGFSTLGYGDPARDASAPFDIGFGQMMPGTAKEIGPATSSQTLPGAAVEATVTGDTDWILQLDASNFSGAGTMSANQLSFKRFGVTEAWTPLTGTPTTVTGPVAPGISTVRHDLRLAVPALQLAGTYGASLAYTVVAAP